MHSLVQTLERWHNATDPLYKMMLKDAIYTLRLDLGMTPMPDSGAGDDSCGTGDRDDAEDEE